MKTPAGLHGRSGVVLDTMVFVYLFENDLACADVCAYIVDLVKQGVFSAIVTPVTAAELLVKPLEKNRLDIADQYRAALQSMDNITCMSLSFRTACMAGALRARYGMPLPDMLQAACALEAAMPALVTNDKDLRKVREIDVFLLRDFR